MRVLTPLVLVLLLLLARGGDGRVDLSTASSTAGCTLLAPGGGDAATRAARLNAALAQAAGSVAHCVALYPGVYDLAQPSPGPMLTIAGDAVHLTGAGEGVTILRLTNTVLSNTTYTTGLYIPGNYAVLSDLTLQGAAQWSGLGDWVAIEADGLAPTISNVEISGIYGTDGAGGFGISLYRPWNLDQARQHALIDHVYIHDSPQACGIVNDADENVIQNSTIVGVGSNAHQHAIYEQGGGNRIIHNTLGPNPGAGYNIHKHDGVPHIYAGGDIIAGNVSLDPGFAHVIVDVMAEDGTNPDLPPGSVNTPDVIITGNTFRNTGGRQTAGLLLDTRAIVQGNVFEGITAGGGATISTSAPATIQGNIILGMQNTVANGRGIDAVGPDTSMLGNQIVLTGSQTAILAGGDRGSVTGNTIVISGGIGLELGGAGSLAQGNQITATGLGGVAVRLTGSAGRLTGNHLRSDGYVALSQDPITATVENNTWTGLWRIDTVFSGLHFANNTGTLSYYGYQALALTADSGRLVALPHVSNSPVSRGDLLAWQAGGLVRAPAGSPTFAGVNLSDGGDTLPALYVVTQPGAVLQGICSQGTPVVGNVGVISLTQAGCVADTGGAEPPPRGSWVRFLPNNEMEIHP